MERAVWNEKTIFASRFAEKGKSEEEKEIRSASAKKQLLCPDENCRGYLKYCHGEKKLPYFSHFTVCNCDYGDFDKRNKPLLKAQYGLYSALCKQGIDAQQEVKVFPRHYANIVITLPEGEKIAVELANITMTAGRFEKIAEQYRRLKMKVCWVVVDDCLNPVEENHTYFIKRQLLNTSENKDMLILDSKGEVLFQQKADPNKYYDLFGHEMESENYPRIFWQKEPVEKITICDGKLLIANFYQSYEKWLSTKKRQYEKKIDEERKKREKILSDTRKETRKWRSDGLQRREIQGDMKQKQEPLVTQKNKQNANYGSCLEEIRELVKCKRCESIKPKSEFSIIDGGVDFPKLGVCSQCMYKKS